ncbi:glycerol-3-phosphate dehydrogenase [Anaeramoeba flamelloides]|uniref:Glycerol-3-phosphate dehydrogenase [NAD(+)] n=1 Tax=Anaeramoeba flamelloides TaxID=1746091 RepID=A0AAV7Y8E2_9EUKA|nr:glycerol-3-phosphate dehydrogenase [nad(+)]-related [Anaeramoeba flamelloides]KAJ6250501.1 glycerol-3-phosphate dehydrogenase [Anaeramoeba flamelloides]
MNSKLLKIGAIGTLVGVTAFTGMHYFGCGSKPIKPFTPIEDEIKKPKTPQKVGIIGSGNWGSAIAKIVGANALKNPDFFVEEVKQYVYEEEFEGRKLTEIINEDHMNKKYLPGIELPENIVADPDLISTVKDADLLIFVLPHQFVPRILGTIKGKLKKGVRAITLIKGVNFIDNKLVLISELIEKELECEVCSLMGANVANEVAQEQYCETSIGYKNVETGVLFWKLFNTENFEVRIVNDVKGPEICGALKNVVAIGAGFCDGVEEYGGNTKAAIMRVGLMEMKQFAQMYYPSVQTETFFESCGVGDLITTCFGGRNRKCAEAFVRTKKSWEEIEKDLLKGQKLQGTGTAIEVYEILKNDNVIDKFPLFKTIYKIVQGKLDPEDIVRYDQLD